MSWGVMMGIGQGLQQVGGMLLDNNKSKIRERLEMEREDRAYARQLERDAKQEAQRLSRPATWHEVEIGGQWAMQARNADGTTLDGVTRPMTAVEIEDFNQKRTKAEQDAEKSRLELLLTGKKVDTYDEDRALDRRKTEASIESSLATAQAARSRAMADKDSGDTPPTNEQLATTLVKEYEGVIEQYAQSETNPDGLTPSEVLQLANAAIAEAQKRKTNARTIFRDSLNIHAAKMPILRGK